MKKIISIKYNEKIEDQLLCLELFENVLGLREKTDPKLDCLKKIMWKHANL